MFSSQSFAVRVHSIRRPFIVCCMAFGALCQCDNEQHCGPFLSMRLLDADDQPQLPNLGVLVAVSARGGNVIRFDVAGGTLDNFGSNNLVPLCVATGTDSNGLLSQQQLALFNQPSTNDVTAFVVAVYPTGQQEAWLNAALGNISNSDSGLEGAVSEPADAGSSLPANDCSHIGFTPIGVYASQVVSLGRAAPSGTGGAGSGQGGSTAAASGGTNSSSTSGGSGGTSEGGGGVTDAGVGGQNADASSDGGAL